MSALTPLKLSGGGSAQALRVRVRSSSPGVGPLKLSGRRDPLPLAGDQPDRGLAYTPKIRQSSAQGQAEKSSFEIISSIRSD